MTKPHLGFQISGWRNRAAALSAKRPTARDARRAAFDAEIQKGVEAAAEGRVKDADAVFDRLEAKYEAMSKRAG